MKNSILFTAIFCLLLSAGAMAQEQFSKKFDISFNHMRLDSALEKLMATQTKMKLYLEGPKLDKSYVTLSLKNINFDLSIGQLLACQDYYKSYSVANRGFFLSLQLSPEIVNTKYFVRDKKVRIYHVGERLPDSAYTLSNYPDSIIRFSAMKKKLVILDLWNVHCGGCILAMPDMQILQQKFRNQIQVILVTKDSRSAVEMLKKTDRIVRETKLPMITGESILPSSFFYKSVPQQIWVDSSGTVIYNTKKLIASEKNIRDFLAGKRLSLYESRDTIVGSDIGNEPLSTTLQFIHQGKFALTAYLAPHLENKYSYGMGADSEFKDADSVKTLINSPTDLFVLYKLAYGIRLDSTSIFSDTRVIRDFKDPEKYQPDYVNNEHVYDYELLTKKKEITDKQYYKMMQAQLDGFFNLKSAVENRMVDCYVLKRTGDKMTLSGVETKTDWEKKEDTLYFQHLPLSFIIGTINRYRTDKIQFVNETGSNAAIDLTLDIDFEDHLDAVRRTLAPYGLTIEKVKRNMDCIVLSDAGDNGVKLIKN
jgi:thiol-disulfide isomerase/thioredoxin